MQEKSVFCSGLLLYIFPLYAHRKGAFIQNHQQDRFLQTGKIFLFHICNAGSCFYILSHTLWKNAGFLKRCPAAALGLSVVLTILLAQVFIIWWKDLRQIFFTEPGKASIMKNRDKTLINFSIKFVGEI